MELWELLRALAFVGLEPGVVFFFFDGEDGGDVNDLEGEAFNGLCFFGSGLDGALVAAMGRCGCELCRVNDPGRVRNPHHRIDNRILTKILWSSSTSMCNDRDSLLSYVSMILYEVPMQWICIHTHMKGRVTKAVTVKAGESLLILYGNNVINTYGGSRHFGNT